MRFKLLFVTYVSVLNIACSSSKKAVTVAVADKPVYKQIKVSGDYNADTAISSFLRPYSLEVDRQMNVVIGETEFPLEKKVPEGTLGNFVADAMKQMAAVSYKKNVDAAFVNAGGLRSDYLKAGQIQLRDMYELMPFDNIIVLMQLNGVQLSQLLNLLAANEGWPVSGIEMKIKDRKAVSVLINGKPISPDSIYTIATTDYTAKGNEGFEMLASIKQENNGYLLRDALIDFVKVHTQKRQKLKYTLEGRISNAE